MVFIHSWKLTLDCLLEKRRSSTVEDGRNNNSDNNSGAFEYIDIDICAL